MLEAIGCQQYVFNNVEELDTLFAAQIQHIYSNSLYNSAYFNDSLL